VRTLLLTNLHCQLHKKQQVGCRSHVCNPSYSGDRDQEDRGSKPTWTNNSRDCISKNNQHKPGLRSDSSVGPWGEREGGKEGGREKGREAGKEGDLTTGYPPQDGNKAMGRLQSVSSKASVGWLVPASLAQTKRPSALPSTWTRI
jgi:hypothetical protein